MGTVTLTCNPDGSVGWTARVAKSCPSSVPDAYTLALQNNQGSGPFQTRSGAPPFGNSLSRTCPVVTTARNETLFVHSGAFGALH